MVVCVCVCVCLRAFSQRTIYRHLFSLSILILRVLEIELRSAGFELLKDVEVLFLFF